MKRVLTIVLLNSILFLNTEVKACGEISNLTSNVGTVTQTNSMNYVISIPNGTDRVTLNANTEYDWVSGYGPREVSTDKKVELKVDGNKCGYGIYTYFITFKSISNLIAENTDTVPTVEETPTPDNNNNNNNETPNEEITIGQLKLSSLIIEGYNIEFDPDTRKYTLNVESNVESLSIEALPEDETYTVNISSDYQKLLEGENTITIALVNAEGVTSTYEIVVNRAKVLSTNNFLASITIQGYALNFDSSQTTYNLTIKKDKMLNMNIVTESELATYEILGNNNLGNGSTVTIRVKAEDDSTRDYVINITKEFNIADYWMYITVGVLILLLIILLIINKNQKKKKKQGPEAIESQTETAGVVPENVAQTVTEPVAPTQTPVQEVPTSPGTLQIIEPTNIESEQQNVSFEPTPVVEQPKQPANEETSTTEVFKL